jgi:hypothetical protein
MGRGRGDVDENRLFPIRLGNKDELTIPVDVQHPSRKQVDERPGGSEHGVAIVFEGLIAGIRLLDDQSQRVFPLPREAKTGRAQAVLPRERCMKMLERRISYRKHLPFPEAEPGSRDRGPA